MQQVPNLVAAKHESLLSFATKRTSTSTICVQCIQHYINTCTTLEKSLCTLKIIASFHMWVHNKKMMNFQQMSPPFTTSKILEKKNPLASTITNATLARHPGLASVNPARWIPVGDILSYP